MGITSAGNGTRSGEPRKERTSPPSLRRRAPLTVPAAFAAHVALGAGLMLAVPAPAQPQTRRVSFRARDAAGAWVDLSSYRGRAVALVALTNPYASEQCRAVLAQIDEVLLNEPALETFLVVDVVGYDNFITRGPARGRLRRSLADARSRRRERRLARGADASDAQIDRFHLVGDFEGRILRLFGVDSFDAGPVAFVVDGDGTVVGPFVGATPGVVARILDAIELSRRRLSAAGGPR